MQVWCEALCSKVVGALSAFASRRHFRRASVANGLPSTERNYNMHFDLASNKKYSLRGRKLHLRLSIQILSDIYTEFANTSQIA